MLLLDEIIPLLPHVSKPIQYVGEEINAIHKHWPDMQVKIGLCFPDTYEVGMSHLGLHLLYAMLNTTSDVVAERIYAPAADMEALMRNRRVPLFSLESHRAAYEFDMLGFTLQYELSYSNVLNMLSLANIPLKSENRTEDDPIIVAGGPCSCNPEPLADFCDLFVIGDGETVLPQIVNMYKISKENRAAKYEFLRQVCSLPGVYVPAFYTVHYHEMGRIAEITPTIKEAPERIRRRIEPNLDTISYLQAPIVPYLKTVHDRLTLEIMRGCSRGCRFCQAGFIYRPVRERSSEHLLLLAKSLLRESGYDEVSLSSLSTGDYTQISFLVGAMMQMCELSKVSLSLPSMRVNTLTEEIASAISRVRKTGFTIAPEAGTQRLRDVMNKGISDDDILKTAEEAFTAGWDLLKLYFMIGLPTETNADIEGLIDLVYRVKKVGNRAAKRKVSPERRRGIKLHVALSSFVPKSHTPFQWERMNSIDELRRKQQRVKDQIRQRAIQLKWHNVQASYLEGVFARGDRKLGQVLYEAHRLGCKFDGWNEHFDFSKWMEAFSRSGSDPDAYISRERGKHELLPWEHIQTGVSKEYLWNERLKAMHEEGTPPCNTHCRRCGLCNGDIQVVESKDGNPVGKDGNPVPFTFSSTPIHRPKAYRVRAIYYKTGLLRFLSHLDLGRVFQRAISRIQAPIAYSQGFHPHSQIAFGPALPVGSEGYKEYLDFFFSEHVDVDAFVKNMNAALPTGVEMIGAYAVDLKASSLSTTLKRFVSWIFASKSLVEQGYTFSYFRRKLDAFQSKDTYLVKGFKNKSETVDIKPFILSLELIPGETDSPGLQMSLRAHSNVIMKPEEVLSLVFDIPYGKILDFRILRVNMEAES